MTHIWIVNQFSTLRIGNAQGISVAEQLSYEILRLNNNQFTDNQLARRSRYRWEGEASAVNTIMVGDFVF